MKPVSMLVIGDGGAPTGYSRVIAGILRHLPQGFYEIHHLATSYDGDPHGEGWKLYPAASRGDFFGINRIKELVEKIKPDLVFSVADLWIQKLYLDELSAGAVKAKLVVYSPVDAGPVDPEWVENFGSASRIVAFTRYARDEMLKALGAKDPPEVDVIPVGVDTDLFFPLTPEKPWNTVEAKRKLNLFPESELEDAFVVLNAHRNQPRKRIDLTLKGFAAFAHGKPGNVQLYLHMGTEDAGWNFLKLARRYGIFDRLILTQNRNDIPGVASVDLNLIYNASDVGLNTATGEGWGLPNMEHAATGKAQVVPRFGALAEIWSECAEFLEPVDEVVYERVLSEGKVVSVAGVAEALERLYASREHRRERAEACYQRVIQPEFQWEGIGRKWHEVFQNGLASMNKYS